MRLSSICVCALVLISGCSPSRPHQNSVIKRLTADTPEATVEGNTFIAPAGWTLIVPLEISSSQEHQGEDE
jgi:hypothetical protein